MMEFKELKFHGREGTTDFNVVKEVFSGAYRKPSIGFDVEPGERWLDLGANIGAFAMYAEARGASVICYEPDRDSFKILQLNVTKSKLINAAVSVNKDIQLPFFTGRSGKFSRNSLLAKSSLEPNGVVRNVWSGELKKLKVDGVKMDIEGAEGPIIDQWLLPGCEKLVLEYHTSRDSSLPNLSRRVGLLRDHFRYVKIPPEYDRAIASGDAEFKSFFDRNIFCWEAKS